MDNPEKLATQGTQLKKQNKNTTKYVLNITGRTQTQITQTKHEPSYKTTGGIEEPNIILGRNCKGHHNMQLRQTMKT